MANLRRRWTVTFLHGLVLAGDARLAAERVGVDHSEVWMRRLREPKFAGLWDAALRLRVEWLALQRAPSPRSASLSRQRPGRAVWGTARFRALPRGERGQ